MWPSMKATQYKGKLRFDDDFFADYVSAPDGHMKATQYKGKLRFDDDFFADYVSAPAVHHQGGSLDVEGVEALHTGASYATLGSVSNFDGEGSEPEDGLPSQEEICATSERIFGSAPPPMSNENGFGAFDLQHVLTTLSAMKHEISEMESDAERKDAAAKVALAFMHGLQMDE
jgi:hypothetical protein